MSIFDNLKPLLEGYEKIESGDEYIGQCNKIRCDIDSKGAQGNTNKRGEAWWKYVMGKRKPTTPEEFIQHVGVDQFEEVMEYDDINDYVADAQREDPDFGMYKSIDPNGDMIYFIQHSGFEFFWRDNG